MTTFEAREQVRRAVHQILKDGPDAGMVSRPVIPDMPDSLTRMEPQPLPAIAALMALRGATRELLHEQARHARGDGEPWERIGGALYGQDSRMTPAELRDRAFRYLASDLGDGPSFSWRCGTCHAVVIDRGPETGSPADAEQGHAPGCVRFAALVRAYEQD